MGTLRRNPRWPRSAEIAANLLSFTLVGAILYTAKVVLVPIAVAVLLTFVLSPLIARLHRWGWPRVPAVIAVVLAVGVVMAGVVWMVTLQMDSLATKLPQYQENIRAKFTSLREGGKGGLIEKVQTTFREVTQKLKQEEEALKSAESPLPPPPVPVKIVRDETADQLWGSAWESFLALGPAFEGLTNAALILILVVFMLIQREDLRNRLVSFTGNGSLATTTKALDDAGQRLSRYLLMQLIINIAFGLCVGIALLVMRVPYAVLWGFCAMVLRYVPFIGPWIAAIFPMTVSLITSPGWTQVLAILGLFVVLDLVIGNVLEPWLYGHGVGISMVANLISAAFWTWIWGPIGLILSIPLTVVLVVLGRYVPALAFLDRLLGDQPALKPHVAYLQRLLAKDDREAAEIVRQFRTASNPETVYDELFIPALALVRHQCENGEITPDQQSAILEATQQILEGLVSPDGLSALPERDQDSLPVITPKGNGSFAETGPPATPTAEIWTLGFPAHHEVEELTLKMLDQLVQRVGIRLEILSTRNLPSELLARVSEQQPKFVCIAALAPAGIIQARFLCRQLRKQFPDLGIIVGFWGYKGNLDKVVVRLRSAGAQYVTTTLLGGREHVLFLANANSVRNPPGNPTVSTNRSEATLRTETSETLISHVHSLGTESVLTRSAAGAKP